MKTIETPRYYGSNYKVHFIIADQPNPDIVEYIVECDNFMIGKHAVALYDIVGNNFFTFPRRYLLYIEDANFTLDQDALLKTVYQTPSFGKCE